MSRAIAKMLALGTILITMQASGPVSAATVTYRMCLGEYERSCQAHDVYEYCYYDVQAWAKAMCGSSIIQHYSSYGGDKCGYEMYMIVCDNPKAAQPSEFKTHPMLQQQR
jgi:hypothetical protein